VQADITGPQFTEIRLADFDKNAGAFVGGNGGKDILKADGKVKRV